MSLTVETGAGVASAASYAAVATADTYWSERAHNALASTWAAATTGNKEGALREATDYLDASFGQYYRGKRAGRVQGLEWPRSDALDDSDVPLPGLPSELVKATCELAARALAGPLAEDQDRGGKVKRERVEGAIEVEYMDGAPSEKSFGIVAKMLAPILNGAQPGSAAPSWEWR